tara:strand:- start:275 stop:484 length:210 start_codon:yes stop_codon:yes gene_type:complete
MKITITTTNELFRATIKKSGMDSELVVAFFEREEPEHLWVIIPFSKYFTDDKEDAMETAHAELENLLAL